MSETHINTSQAQQDIAELIDRDAGSGERIVLISRGKPKAVLISLDDYAQLADQEAERRRAQWPVWQEQIQALSTTILERRRGKPLDLGRLWNEIRADREAREDDVLD